DPEGLEVCRRLKANPATAAIPVLHLRATYGPSYHAAAQAAGADGYLNSPTEPIVLVAAIRALLRARQAESQVRKVSQLWQTTFDAMADGMALLDPQGVVLRCNRAMAAMM